MTDFAEVHHELSEEEDERVLTEPQADKVVRESGTTSAKLVYYLLKKEGAMTKKQMHDDYQIHRRSLKTALDDMQGYGVVEEGICPMDARKNLYHLNTE
jgi:hypothetical protein